MCPELITEGHVYSAVPPLYRITTKKNEYIYLNNDEDLAEFKKTTKETGYIIGRNKGLGEQDSEELSVSLLDPATRNVYQLYVDDYAKTNKMFEDLYGKRVEARVRYIQEHGEELIVDEDRVS